MSQENVEVVRRFIDAHRQNDWGRLASDFLDPDADYYPARKFPEARPCHGIDEIDGFMARYRAAWGRYEIELKKLIPVADDRVLVQIGLQAEGRESGVKLDGDLYQCMWLRHGRVYRWEDHLTASGALRALGLNGETLEAAGLQE